MRILRGLTTLLIMISGVALTGSDARGGATYLGGNLEYHDSGYVVDSANPDGMYAYLTQQRIDQTTSMPNITSYFAGTYSSNSVVSNTTVSGTASLAPGFTNFHTLTASTSDTSSNAITSNYPSYSFIYSYSRFNSEFQIDTPTTFVFTYSRSASGTGTPATGTYEFEANVQFRNEGLNQTIVFSDYDINNGVVSESNQGLASGSTITLAPGTYQISTDAYISSRFDGRSNSASGSATGNAHASATLTDATVVSTPEPSTIASALIAGLAGVMLTVRSRTREARSKRK